VTGTWSADEAANVATGEPDAKLCGSRLATRLNRLRGEEKRQALRRISEFVAILVEWERASTNGLTGSPDADDEEAGDP